MRRTTLVVLAVAGLLAACWPSTETPSPTPAALDPASSHGADADLDGQIAYSAGVEHQIFLLDLATGESHQLTELTEEHAELLGQGPLRPVISCGFGVSALEWSPDGTRLAFPYGGCETVLYVVDLEGNLTRIADGGSPAWSPDGGLLVFRPNIPFCMGVDCGRAPRAGAWNLQIVDVASGDAPVPLMIGDATSQASSPTWSPDGSLLAFSVWGTADEPELFNTTYVADGDGSNVRRIADGAWPQGWLSDGRLLIVEEQTGVVHAIDLGSGDSAAIDGGFDGTVAVSPDGTRYAKDTFDPETGAPTTRLATIDGDRIGERAGSIGAWAADGSAIALVDLEGAHGLVILDREGNELRTYELPEPLNVNAVAWQPGPER